ncbi:16S rRNA (uracil(1498)-N(3))-methyltransferase [Arcobacter sp. FWKO B]|uniref:16S rRNA (uracil(1498)-N(3))-methyltransferase n=1 Tax=Arcobacter sp. FWKO B TaxID=2593672 RepID=UPI0018A59C88|nr:16S rRNA (uracil(1498)-N(3))-methyltransferase [Arcobacter sp. FWKO B]QOG11734.1 16S rRNA (uracil(1498)-N(3))-methyltransferase [Arcobacter sp. FWKO B]
MQFSYHKNAGDSILEIDGELYNYLFKIRRHKSDETFDFRNLTDSFIYTYKTQNISKKSAIIELIQSLDKPQISSNTIHIGWCVVDPKTIEKTLPFLNELGVSKISFIYSDFSQKNFKINYERIEKIIINSCMQCGRSDLIKFEEYKNIKEFLNIYPSSFILDFSNNTISKEMDIDTIIIGSEGGFSQNERKLFSQNQIVGLKHNLILRSETAVISIASNRLIL